MISRIEEFAPTGTESGTGLALRDETGRYLFFVAGTRHRCPPGELFYAGIGGHREPGEDWVACAHREAAEEIGARVLVRDAVTTWYLPRDSTPEVVQLADRPRPLALYEMVHPTGTPRAGELYRLVIYEASLAERPATLAEEEVRGVIALTAEQIIRGPGRRPTLARLLAEGAAVVAGGESLDAGVRLYPLGTASALAQVLAIAGA